MIMRPARNRASAGAPCAWRVAALAVFGWTAIDLALAAFRTLAVDAPRPIPHRVAAALGGCSLVAVTTALMVGRALSRRRAARWHDGAGTAALAATGTALFVTTCFDVLFTSRLLDGLLPTHQRTIEESLFAAGLALVFASSVRSARHPADSGQGPTDRGAGSLTRMAALATVVLVACEGALALLAILRPSPLLAAGAAASDHFEAFRLEPGSSRFGFTVNTAGFYDDEPFVAGPDDLLIAVVGDSIVVGVVPWDRNFVTVAERALTAEAGDTRRRIALQNWGVAGAGPREYEWLLHGSVLPTGPNTVVITLFVGNDILDIEDPETHASLRHWLLWQVPRRLVIAARAGVLADPAANARGQDGAATTTRRAGPGRPRADGEIPDFVLDPSRERPSFGEIQFLDIERRRAAVLDPGDERTRRQLERTLEVIRRWNAELGPRLLLLVIPDEMQVNDTLWDRVRGSLDGGARFDRDFPQREIHRLCVERGIDCLDILPALREAEAGGRTYHLQDTHPNTRGNAVIGGRLAQALRARLGPPR